jgi:hypothetical protein
MICTHRIQFPGFSSDSVDLPWKFCNAVLGKDGEDQVDNSCKNEEVLRRFKKETNILNKMKIKKAN